MAVPVIPPDVGACKEKCLLYASCTTFDYNSEHPEGKVCWVHGSWSHLRPERVDSVDHYILDRTCVDPGNKFKSFSHNY